MLAPTGESQGLLSRVGDRVGLLGVGLRGVVGIAEEGDNQGGACLVTLAAQHGRQLLDDFDALFALQLGCLVAHFDDRPALVVVNLRLLGCAVALGVLRCILLPQLSDESRRLRGRFGIKRLFLMWPGAKQASMR